MWISFLSSSPSQIANFERLFVCFSLIISASRNDFRDSWLQQCAKHAAHDAAIGIRYDSLPVVYRLLTNGWHQSMPLYQVFLNKVEHIPKLNTPLYCCKRQSKGTFISLSNNILYLKMQPGQDCCLTILLKIPLNIIYLYGRLLCFNDTMTRS